MSEFGKELIESSKEALAIARGEMKPAKSYAFDGVMLLKIIDDAPEIVARAVGRS